MNRVLVGKPTKERRSLARNKAKVERSLVGRSTAVVRGWADWYIKRRKLESFTVDELLKEVQREHGTRAGVTMTKIRRAAERLAARGVTK